MAKPKAKRKKFVLRGSDVSPRAAEHVAALERAVKTPDAVTVQDAPLPVAAPLRRNDLVSMHAIVEGDSIRISQPMLVLLHEAIAGGYDSVRILKATRLSDNRFEVTLGIDRTLGAGLELF